MHMHGSTHHHHHHMMYARILATLQHCAATCEHMSVMLLHKHDVHKREHQIHLLRDCADICETTTKYIARHSHLANNLAMYCAYICELCASECLKFQDEESKHCAQVCLHCAHECRFLAMSV